MLRNSCTAFLGMDSGASARILGTLFLLTDGLHFQARFAKKEIFIPRSSIVYLGVDSVEPALVVHYLSPRGEQESAAFRVPAPEQWVAAVKAGLFPKKPQAPQKRPKS